MQVRDLHGETGSNVVGIHQIALFVDQWAHSHNLISRTRLLASKFGHRLSDCFRRFDFKLPFFVGTFHFSRGVSDEDRACSVSTRLCSQDPIFETKKNRIVEIRLCE